MRPTALAVAALAALSLAGCGGPTRKVSESTGSAKATVTTKAPESEVSNSALQQQAQSAATAVSTPVPGMNATGGAPAMDAASAAPPAPGTTVTTSTTTTTDHTGR